MLGGGGGGEDGPLEVGWAFQGVLDPDVLATYSTSLLQHVKVAGERDLAERGELLERLKSGLLDALENGGRDTPSLAEVEDLSLHAFGSSVMGISRPGGDLDISLEGVVVVGSGKSVRLSDAAKDFKIRLLREVHGVLRSQAHFRRGRGMSELVTGARWPISKFVEAVTGINCDLSIGNTTGVFKSAVLGEVLRIDPRVRELAMLVKKWARANEVNDPSNGTFNSYCLTLLVVAFAQSRQPPLLPPFRELFPRLRDAIGGKATCGEDLSPPLLSRVEEFRMLAQAWAERHAGKNQETLAELFLGFLVSLSSLANKARRAKKRKAYSGASNRRPSASPWEGGFVDLSWERYALVNHHFFVRDPFEDQDNCARTLKTEDWAFVVQLLSETAARIDSFLRLPVDEMNVEWQALLGFVFKTRPQASEARGRDASGLEQQPVGQQHPFLPHGAVPPGLTAFPGGYFHPGMMSMPVQFPPASFPAFPVMNQPQALLSGLEAPPYFMPRWAGLYPGSVPVGYGGMPYQPPPPPLPRPGAFYRPAEANSAANN